MVGDKKNVYIAFEAWLANKMVFIKGFVSMCPFFVIINFLLFKGICFNLNEEILIAWSRRRATQYGKPSY